MATITELARKDTRAGSNRSWHSHTYTEQGNTYREIYHYSTLMLRYTCGRYAKGPFGNRYDWDGDLNTVYYTLGHGSVSDQHGMNQLFRELGMPLYFSRAGGAEINRTDRRVG